MGAGYTTGELAGSHRGIKRARTPEDEIRILNYVIDKVTRKYYRWSVSLFGCDKERLSHDMVTLTRCGERLIGLNRSDATARAERLLEEMDYLLPFRKPHT